MLELDVDQEIELSDVTVDDLLGNKLVVYNDDHNSFEYVIECFVAYLKHSAEQAEQLAWIIHSKGKAVVKDGTKEELEPIHRALVDAGLAAEIE